LRLGNTTAVFEIIQPTNFMEKKMNCLHLSKIAFLLVVLVTVISCKSKQDKPDASSGVPQEKASITAVTSQGQTKAPAASAQDKTDARTAAAHILSQFEAGEFQQLYKESAPGFKQIGSESAFVTKFQQTRQKVGVLKNPQEVSFTARPDNIHVLIYRLENELFTTEMRLSFERAKNGKMELAGLNQHDEPKK
jgi:hypothetical protein